MKCKCSKPAVSSKYCKDHFIEYFESKVKQTIKDHKMLSKKDKVAVGCSGGKDSTSLLYILHKLGYNVTAIAIDEGIKGYRDKSLIHLQNFCKEHDIPLVIHSFKDNFGKALDQMNTKNVGGNPCTTCGTFRRYLLNKETANYNKIAVGHNLDDEAQSILMNLFKGQEFMLNRIGPITEEIKNFTVRIKPLYFLKEKEVATYAFLKGFLDKYEECPNAKLAYRIQLRDLLNQYEQDNPGTKEAILTKFLKVKKQQKTSQIKQCKECKQPSSRDICKACEIKPLV
ncbi:TIGR00269 family protein [Nanoarchaeota archaeon]